MRRLFPTPAGAHPGDITIAEAYATSLGSHEDGRPWVGLCMVASLDGSTVVDGRSAGLSSSTDSRVLLQLRSVADVIVVGAGTAHGEGYGPPSKPGQRIGVVTASGSIDASSGLFSSGGGFVITTESAPPQPAGIDVIRAGRDEVHLAAAIAMIPTLCPHCEFVQVEGGATLNGALASDDLFDELNLTTSPILAGGTGPRLTTGADDVTQRFELAQLAIDEQSFVFSRWRRRRATSSP